MNKRVEVRRKEDEMTFAFGTLGVMSVCICMREHMRQYVFVSVFRKYHCVFDTKTKSLCKESSTGLLRGDCVLRRRAQRREQKNAPLLIILA